MGALFVGSAAFGAGEYQKARDGKTMIWNWQPKSGETASWSGDRDKDGYASGFGDLTWYNANGKVFGLFYGNMAHGKFEGGVNVHTGGRVAHSYFVNGERVTSWGHGAAKSTMTASEAAVVEKSRAEKPKKERIERAEAVATPTPKKEKAETIAKTEPASAEELRRSKPTPPPAAPKTSGAETYHKETAEKPARETTVAEKKNEPLSAEEELKRTEPERSTPEPAKPERHKNESERGLASENASKSSSTRPFTEPTAIPGLKAEVSPSTPIEKPSAPEKESSSLALQETAPALHQEIAAESSPRSTETGAAESNAQTSSKETPSDVSLNSLVGPPSSLRSNAASSSENKQSASPPRTDEPLTESEAVKLADNEARSQGCPIDSYERPKIDHSKVKGKWTLFYALKKDETGRDLPEAFSATVEDKTKKVDIRK